MHTFYNYIILFLNYACTPLQTLYSVCRIAEVLISLQQAGNVRYIGWKMELCCQTVLVEDLQGLAKGMEEELVEWNKEVTLSRKKFYELNNYTMRQLLLLRGELGGLKSGRAPQSLQWEQVMALLESISSEITPSALANLVQAVDSQPLMDDSEGEEEAHSLVHPSTPEELDHSVQSVALSSVNQLASGRHPATHTGQSVPHPRLSLQDLNDEEAARFTDIIESYGFSEMTALKAIEEVGDGDWNDIEKWLEENAVECEESFRGAQDGGHGDPEECNVLVESEGEEDEQSCPDLRASLLPTSSDSKLWSLLLHFLIFCCRCGYPTVPWCRSLTIISIPVQSDLH